MNGTFDFDIFGICPGDRRVRFKDLNDTCLPETILVSRFGQPRQLHEHNDSGYNIILLGHSNNQQNVH